MFNFKTSQKTFEIGKVKLGGQPGENPTVLIGSLFYHKHKILINEKTGEIDKDNTEKLIKAQEEFSEKTGNPCMIDLVGAYEEAITKLISFVSDVTDTIILIDSPNPQVRIAGAKYVSEVGLSSRVIYNSLIPETKTFEFEAIKESGIESSILLTYKKGVMTSRNRVEAVKELLPKAQEVGISKPLIDAFVLDIPSLGLASRSIIDIKSELGLPCGCGAHNAISTWYGFDKRMGAQAIKPCTTVVNTIPVAFGADFILYGPIEDSKYVFPAVYATDNINRYLYKTKQGLEI